MLAERDAHIQQLEAEIHLQAGEKAKLRAALWAVLKVRPDNWDDDDDPEQVAAWRLVQDALGPACVNHPDQPSIVNLDNEDLCHECANAWARSEGQAAAEREAEEAEHLKDAR